MHVMQQSALASSHSFILLLTCSEKERSRGDKAMWAIDDHRNIGFYGKDNKFVPKYRYDTVLGPAVDNQEVGA